MDVKKQIPKSDTEIKCFNIITNKKDKHYGEKCNRLLLKKNSMDRAAGQIRCPRCKALYEIIDNKIKLISRGEKK